MHDKPPMMGLIPHYEYVLTIPNAEKSVTRSLTFNYGDLTENEAKAIRDAFAQLYGVEIPMRRYEKDFKEM